MASGGKKRGDVVLEGRHLIGLFLLLVVIFGIVFTLGYLLGRSQANLRLQAAARGSAKAKRESASAAKASDKPESTGSNLVVPPGGSDWDFYHAADRKPDEERLQPVKKAPAKPHSAPAQSSRTRPEKRRKARLTHSLNGPLIPRGAIMLQVAAVRRQSDALALAQALQQKKFPAFVLTPSTDKYYRIQVGPYADSRSAAIARRELEAKGFKSIIKR